MGCSSVSLYHWFSFLPEFPVKKRKPSRIWPYSPLSGWGVCAGDITGHWPALVFCPWVCEQGGAVTWFGMCHPVGVRPPEERTVGVVGIRIGWSAQRWKEACLPQKAVSFCLPESRKPFRRMCWGHPDNHEHSAIIQTRNWDLCEDVDQPGLPPVEGLCIQLGHTVFTKGISFTSSHACLLTLRPARADVSTWLRCLLRPTGHQWKGPWCGDAFHVGEACLLTVHLRPTHRLLQRWGWCDRFLNFLIFTFRTWKPCVLSHLDVIDVIELLCVGVGPRT